MSYTLLRGSFVIRYPKEPRNGPEPDGDTVKFRPDDRALVEALPRLSGRPPDLGRNGVSVRLEAVDALETHVAGHHHQELAGARQARDELLARLGFTHVVFFPTQPDQVRSADQDALRGHVLSNGIDANGRMIGFAYPGDPAEPDGTAVFVDEARVDASVNAHLLAAGLVYPAFYTSLPDTLRSHLARASTAAREADPPLGLWPRSTADPDGLATIFTLDEAEALVMWPKLFRRLVPYFAAGHADFDAFDAWLREDPVNRDDRIILLDTQRRARLHDVVTAFRHSIQLTRRPEEFVIVPDPPPGHHPSEPTVGRGTVVVVAALPDPVGADAGAETVSLLNTTADGVEIAGWALVDAHGGRHELAGSIAAGEVVRVTVGKLMPLGNAGDTITLVDDTESTVDRVDYPAARIRQGRTIAFGR